MATNLQPTTSRIIEPESVLSTDHVHARERSSYWADLVCDVFVQLDCQRMGDGFFGHIADRPLGDVRLSEVSSTAHHVRRTGRMLSRADEDCMLLSLQMHGTGSVEQDGRQAILQPGDFALYDSTRQYDLKFESDFAQLVLKTPRAMFLDRFAGSESATGVRISGSAGMGRVASSFIREVAREAHTLLPHEIERVTHNAIDVMAAALGHTLLDQPVRQSSTKAAQLIRIKLYIDSHLSDAALSPERIAGANGISTRYLNKLFESEAVSVCRWIWDHRLQRIAQDLVDPAFACRSISEIALRWGFNNLSHFSRLFKDRYKLCARDYRAKHRQMH